MSEVLFGTVASLLGGLLLIGGVNRFVTAVQTYRSRTVPVREAARADGELEFEGRVADRSEAGEHQHGDEGSDGVFAAPFSGKPAVICKVWMETASQHRTDADGLEVGGVQGHSNTQNTEHSWGLVESDEIRQPFVVADGGGRVEVDPSIADLDLAGHMGESVLTVGDNEELPDEACERLAVLAERDVGFDTDPETWEAVENTAQYREERLEPGDPVHVLGAEVLSRPEEWGSAIDATVGGDGDSFLISRGDEGEVLRRNVTQFVTGIVIGTGLLAGGLRLLGAI